MYTVSFDMEIPNISGTTESKDQFLGKQHDMECRYAYRK